MDEDQQEEQQQQQEQSIAPAAFTNFNITPAPRRPISSFSLFNRQALERDESISGAVRRNESAIKSINLTLVNVTGQVVNLSKSLNVVAKKLQESSTLEKMKMDQEKRQQQALADRNARRGTENTLEKGIQAALFAPVRRIGAKTRFTLGRLVQFFNILLGGFLVMRAIKLIGALTSGNKEQLKEVTDGIIKQLTAVGGIFLAINGGLVLALRSITRLASFLTQVAVTNLLIRPIQLIFKIAKAAALAIAAGMRGPGGLPPVVPPGPNTNRPNTTTPKGKNRNRLFKGFGLSLGAFDTGAKIAAGGDPGRELSGFGGEIGLTVVMNNIGKLLQKSKNPRLVSLGSGLRLFSFPIGFYLGEPIGKSIFDQTLGLEAITGGSGDLFDTTLDRVNTNNVDVNVVPIQNEAPMSIEGRAALLMFAPPSNPNNPYVLNSYIQYNVIPV